MKPNRLRLLVIAILATGAILTTGSARASMTLNYSYTFGNGLVVTGSLDGDQNGQFVENVSDVSVFFNGTPMSGTLYIRASFLLIGAMYWLFFFDVNQICFAFANSGAGVDIGLLRDRTSRRSK